jgi:Na+/H+ antiporter NhaC
MILPAAIIAVILYWVMGKGSAGEGFRQSITWKHIWAITPYLFILTGALMGGNVMALLFLGTIAAMLAGLLSGSFTFWTALAEAGKGTLGMSETLIVALLAGGLLRVIQHNGGIKYLLNKIEKMVSSRKGCELGVILLVGAVNLFTANNTVAIVISGPIARVLSEKFQCSPRRIASLLDTMSCVVQGLIPYGAQILIAIGIAKNMGLEIPSIKLLSSLYYPMLLAGAILFSIFIRKGSRK